MKKGLTELVFVLDRSCSMEGLENNTIGGFNEMLMKQRREEGEANVTTVLFDDQIEIIHDRFPIDIVEPLTEKEYYVRGCTALLDAVGFTVKKLENIQYRLPERMRAEKIIFVIITDGEENASHAYSYKMVKRMIEENQEKGWQFLFLGANIDAVNEAKNLGIRSSHAASYKNDSRGVELNFQATGQILTFLRNNDCDEEELDSRIPCFLQEVDSHLKGK